MAISIRLHDPTLAKAQCYVNGSWVCARSGSTFAVQNPSTSSLIAECPEFDHHDTSAAISAAQNAQRQTRNISPKVRSSWLSKWCQLMLDNIEDLATIITVENGKPLADARAEVKYAASFFDWFSGEALRIYGDSITASNPNHRIVTTKEPVGVCALIAPWNFPAAMISRKVGPALAAGCTTVVKAPGECPLTALAMAELAHRAGIPPGVVNVITAFENTSKVGHLLTTHPAIRKVSFTGSTAVGQLLMKQCSSTLKKLSMELGGNAPFIVFDDADVDGAVDGLLASKFRISGQTCVCANRIYVHRSVYDKFLSSLIIKVRQFKIGDGLDELTTHGPLIHSRAIEKVEAHVEDALGKGARLAYGGTRLPHLGPNFYDTTILTDITAEMRVHQEETFGPVAAIMTFESEEEVVSMANQSEVGLGAYIYSKDVNRCWKIAEDLEVGMVGVNTGVISDPVAPFGGIKQSGFGREGSKYGIDEFLTIKTVTMKVA